MALSQLPPPWSIATERVSGTHGAVVGHHHRPRPAVSRSQSLCWFVVGNFVAVFRSSPAFPQFSFRPGLLYAFFAHPLDAGPIDKTLFCVSDDVKRPSRRNSVGSSKEKFVSELFVGTAAVTARGRTCYSTLYKYVGGIPIRKHARRSLVSVVFLLCKPTYPTRQTSRESSTH